MREEVRKGMREKAEQGIYPSRPPRGYRNNKTEHTIELDPPNVPIAKRIFELYATGRYSLASLRKVIQEEFGKKFQKGYLHKLFGKCDLPYMREEKVGENLSQILKDIHIPDDVLSQLQNSIREDSKQIREENATHRGRLGQHLSAVRLQNRSVLPG